MRNLILVLEEGGVSRWPRTFLKNDDGLQVVGHFPPMTDHLPFSGDDASWAMPVTNWTQGQLGVGAGCVLKARGGVSSEVSFPRPARSREWLKAALVECQ